MPKLKSLRACRKQKWLLHSQVHDFFAMIIYVNEDLWG